MTIAKLPEEVHLIVFRTQYNSVSDEAVICFAYSHTEACNLRDDWVAYLKTAPIKRVTEQGRYTTPRELVAYEAERAAWRAAQPKHLAIFASIGLHTEGEYVIVSTTLGTC
jgi:hypothetical protein